MASNSIAPKNDGDTPRSGPSSTGSQIMLFGPTSITGYALARRFPGEIMPVCTSRTRAPVTRAWPRIDLDDDGETLQRFLRDHAPPALIYAHAVCDVPKCEEHPAWARGINVGCLARVLDSVQEETRVVYVSSDHVFGGDGAYTERSDPAPVSVYGRTRVDAERLVLKRPGSLVVRVGLPLGPSPDGRSGHIDWLRYRKQNGLPITIVHDEYRSVVWADDLAARLALLTRSDVTGLRHVAAPGVSRPELATALLGAMGLPPGFSVRSRRQQPAPHLGRVELGTVHTDALAEPLSSPAGGSGELPGPCAV